MADCSSGLSNNDNVFAIVPAAIFCDGICPYLQAMDLLSIRMTSKKLYDMLHKEHDVEEFWKRRLKIDFHLNDDNNNNNLHNSNDNNSSWWRQTLQVQPKENNSTIRSIFGVDPGNENNNNNSLIVYAPSAFDSWKSWLKAKRRFGCNNNNNKNKKNNDKNQQQSKSTTTTTTTTTNDDDYHDDILFHAPYFLRAATIWNQIYYWCRYICEQEEEQSNMMGRRIIQKFHVGLHLHDWPIEFQTLHTLQATHAVFAFCGSQARQLEHLNSSFNNNITIEAAFDGIIGGYQAYGYYSISKLVCIPQTTTTTQRDHNHHYQIIVGDCLLSRQQGVLRTLRIDAHTGKLYFQCHRNMSIPVISSRASTANDDDDDNNTVLSSSSEDILTWLEEHCRRLISGEIGIGVMGTHSRDPKALLLFPRFPKNVLSSSSPSSLLPLMTEGVPLVSRAVVRGIEIIGSSVYVPQGAERFGFIYSIRIRLLTPQDGESNGYQTPEQRGFESCQLHMRHWKIKDDITGHTDTVSGPGVIGMYPILHEGWYVESGDRSSTGTFQYQSCTGPMNCGSFSGFIEFIPGSLTVPTGEPFHAEVRPFRLTSRPQFLY